MHRVPVLRNAGRARLLRGVPPNSAARLLHWWYASWAYCFQDRRARQCPEMRSERPSLCPGNAVCFRRACSHCLQRALRQAGGVKTGSTSWAAIWIEERSGLPKLPIQDWPEKIYLALYFFRVQRQNFLQLLQSKVLSLDMFTHQFSMELLNIVYETIESYRKGTEAANQVRKRMDLK